MKAAKLYQILPALLVLLASTSGAGAADLWRSYQLAQQQDKQYQAARLNHQADQLIIPEARAALLPSLSAGGGINRNDVNAVDPVYSDEYNLSLRQPVVDIASHLKLNRAETAVEISDLSLLIEQQSLILRVANRYFELLAAIDNLDLVRAETASNLRQLELARSRFEVGLGTRTDVYEAQARASLARSGEVRAVNLLADARQGLTEITLADQLDPVRLTSDVSSIQLQLNDQAYWIATAQKDNLELQRSRQGLTAAQLNIKVERAAGYPTVDLLASLQNKKTTGSFLGGGTERHNNSIALRLNIPLFTGGKVSARTAGSDLRYQAAVQSHESELRSIERTVRKAYQAVSSFVAQIQALQDAVKAGERTLQARQDAYSVGAETNKNVLDTQRDLFRSRRDLLKSRYDYILSWLALKQSSGVLQADDLKAINQLLG